MTNLMNRPIRMLALMLVIVGLSACSVNNGPGNSFKNAPSSAEYARMDAEKKASAAAAVQQGVAAKNDWWLNIGLPIYLSGEPVQIGNKQTGRTLMWDPLLRVTYVYAGHTNGSGGLEQNSAQAFKTDARGNILDEAGQLLANVATQEGIGRFGFRIGAQIVAPLGSGALAAQIHSNASCDSNCSGDLTQILVESNSNAQGTGTATASAGTGCATCGLLKP